MKRLSRRDLKTVLFGATFLFAAVTRGVEPPPDGGYLNSVTAEGEDVLFNVTTDGNSFTGVGYHAMYDFTSGGQPATAVGASAISNVSLSVLCTALGFQACMIGGAGSVVGYKAHLNGPHSNQVIGANALNVDATPLGCAAIGSGAL